VFHKRHKLAEANVPQSWVQTGAWHAWEPPLNVVRGESHRQDVLARYCGPPTVLGYPVPVEGVLCREPNNPVDPYAIRVEVEGEHVGYVAEEIAAQLSPALDKAGCQRFIVAGVIRGGAIDAPSIGFHLWLGRRIVPGPSIILNENIRSSPEYAVKWRGVERHQNFVPSDEAQRDVPGIHTGASMHGGRWTGIDQRDRLATIKSAREFLRCETDPLERHFAYNLLEETLYKCRDVISGAFDDFRLTCEQHHREMSTIRPSLVGLFGRIPLLPTYRQMAIACSKSGDYDAAAQWCTWGLEIYGDEALEIAPVEDLETRLNRLTRKISSL